MSWVFRARQKHCVGTLSSVDWLLNAYMWSVLQAVPNARNGVLPTYQPLAGAYDELVLADGSPRPHTRRIHALLEGTPAREFARYQSLAELSLFNQGVTFQVYADQQGTEKIMPICLVPRVIGAAEWARVEVGLVQRIRALNMFLDDMYGEQKILKQGVIPADLVLGA